MSGKRILNLKKKVKRQERIGRVRQVFDFKNEEKLSKAIFTVLMVSVIVLVAGSGAFAYFKRTASDSNFDYGYGYGHNGTGYGYGYGYGYGANVSDGWDYGFWGNDGSASSVSATPSGTTALVISYSTNYYAKNRIHYGTTNTGSCATLSSTSSQTDFQTGSNSITISDLTCGTTYYYCVESEDAGANAWYTSIKSKATGDCPSGEEEEEEEEETGTGAVVLPVFLGGGAVAGAGAGAPGTHYKVSSISSEQGGQVTLLTAEGDSLRVSIPQGAVSADVKLSLESTMVSSLLERGVLGPNPAGLFQVGERAFQVKVTDADGNLVEEFSKTIELTFTYTDEQAEYLKEETLQVYKWDGSQWISLGSNVDAENNIVTTEVNAFSWFAVFGEKKSIEEMTPTELRTKIKEVVEKLIILLTKQILMLIARLVDLLTQEVAGLVG